MQIEIKGIRKNYATPQTGARMGLRDGDVRYTFIVKQDIITQMKEFAQQNNMSIRDTMEHLLTQSLEAAKND